VAEPDSETLIAAALKALRADPWAWNDEDDVMIEAAVRIVVEVVLAETGHTGA
jgi:hypothetical protein